MNVDNTDGLSHSAQTAPTGTNRVSEGHLLQRQTRQLARPSLLPPAGNDGAVEQVVAQTSVASKSMHADAHSVLDEAQQVGSAAFDFDELDLDATVGAVPISNQPNLSEDEVFNQVVNHFPLLSDQQVHEFLTGNYEQRGDEIRQAIWSWTHFLGYDNERLVQIDRGQAIRIRNDEAGRMVKLTDRSNVDKDGCARTIFSCANARNVNMYSQVMLDAALNMPGLTSNDLMFILDNYVMGSGSMYGQDITFNTLENRDKVFSSAVFGWDTLEFLSSGKEGGDFAEMGNLVAADQFISRGAAVKAFKKLMPSRDNAMPFFQAVFNFRYLKTSDEIFCHLGDRGAKFFVNAARSLNIDLLEGDPPCAPVLKALKKAGAA